MPNISYMQLTEADIGRLRARNVIASDEIVEQKGDLVVARNATTGAIRVIPETALDSAGVRIRQLLKG